MERRTTLFFLESTKIYAQVMQNHARFPNATGYLCLLESAAGWLIMLHVVHAATSIDEQEGCSVFTL